MDPNANLAEQRSLAASILQDYESDKAPDIMDVGRLAELVQALDEWITKGGFLPKDWKRK